jgi:hypothetical protein
MHVQLGSRAKRKGERKGDPGEMEAVIYVISLADELELWIHDLVPENN